jgi:hypothetical protein
MIMQSIDSKFETKEWLKAWTASIGDQVRAGKNVIVFYDTRSSTRRRFGPP